MPFVESHKFRFMSITKFQRAALQVDPNNFIGGGKGEVGNVSDLLSDFLLKQKVPG